MWTGSPAPTRPAGGRINTQQRSDASFLPASSFSLRGATRVARLGLHQHQATTLARASQHASRLSATLTGKDAVPAVVSYTVQKGETLWDVAVQHGVSMRTIKELNKLPGGSEPVLTEGQQLLVPASGITAVATLDGATSAAALGSTPARGLWVGSEHVRLATVGEAKELYLRQCDRGNSQNTLLVLYAPWCPHCRDMEDELERLAEGLSHVAAVRVVGVNADSAEGRMFAREVLGVAYYPFIISFPAHARTFFKYKGRQRDAESLLRFLNMTCCAREDQMWGLRPVGPHSATVVVPTGKWVNQIVPLGITPGALTSAVGLLALVAAATAAVVATRRRRAAAAAGGAAAVEADVVAELDSSLGRMAALMLRAVGTRLGLLLGLLGASTPGAAEAPPPAPLAVAEAQCATADTAAGPAARSPSPAALAAQRRRASRNHSSLSGSGGSDAGSGPLTSAGSTWTTEPRAALENGLARTGPIAGSAAEPAALRSGGVAATAVAVSPASSFSSSSPSSLSDPSLGPARELTAEERMRLTRLTDDELIALVNSDPDLDKVLTRLLGDK